MFRLAAGMLKNSPFQLQVMLGQAMELDFEPQRGDHLFLTFSLNSEI